MTPQVPGLVGLLDGIDLVIFDKDGTLIDFDSMWAGWIVSIADRLEEELGQPLRAALYAGLGFDPEAGRATPGGPLAVMPMTDQRRLVTALVAEVAGSTEAATRAVEAAWHAPDPVALARPLADLDGLFRALRESRRLVAIATSDDRAPTEATLAGLGLTGLVDALVCADDGLPVKPDRASVLAICATLRVPLPRAAVVGDAPIDLAMARAAGVGLVVGVLSGVGGEGDLAPLADVLLGSVAELLATG